MFTGIVEEVGAVERAEARSGGTSFRIRGPVVTRTLAVGDSVSVAGVCLTVTSLEGETFSADAVPETLTRSNLGDLRVGSAVNLERAVAQGRTFGGHYVQGHVDGTAEVTSVEPEGESVRVRFAAAPELVRFIVEKGYVAIDGVSLTVVMVDSAGFAVVLVPHTRKAVTLGALVPGARVNLEIDVVAKYVDRAVAGRLEAAEARIEELESRLRQRWT